MSFVTELGNTRSLSGSGGRLFKKTNAERFMEYVTPVTESGCWIWMGKKRSNSVGLKHEYGFTSIGRGEKHDVRAHRLSYTMFRGDIPAGMNVLHRCDVTLCVNPDHLFLGTQAENIADCISKGRFNPRRHRGMDRSMPESQP